MIFLPKFTHKCVVFISKIQVRFGTPCTWTLFCVSSKALPQRSLCWKIGHWYTFIHNKCTHSYLASKSSSIYPRFFITNMYIYYRMKHIPINFIAMIFIWCTFKKQWLTLKITSRSNIKTPATGKLFLPKANIQQIMAGMGPIRIRYNVPYTYVSKIVIAIEIIVHSNECSIVLKI